LHLLPFRAESLTLQRTTRFRADQNMPDEQQAGAIGEQEKEERAKIKIEWRDIWEIHKQCDALLHSRLTAFTALQAFSIAAYIALTVARFSSSLPPERADYVEYGRFGLILFGMLTALFGWMVTFPMLVRIRFLNGEYLCNEKLFQQEAAAYTRYMYESLEDRRYNTLFYNRESTSATPKLGRARIWPRYTSVIPVFLPAVEMLLWLAFLALQILGMHATSASSTTLYYYTPVIHHYP
jgi:hypothetical protein